MQQKERQMIELTKEQGRELEGEGVRVIDPNTKRVFVLISEEAYERIQSLLVPGRISSHEQQALLHAAGLRAGWDDPEMNAYDCEEASQQGP
jgi:hypothetical protein